MSDQVPTVVVRCMIKCPTTRRSCPKDTHRSLTLASFAPTHDLQKIFWGGQNKPAVFFPQRGRIESFGSDFLTWLASKPARKPYQTNQTTPSHPKIGHFPIGNGHFCNSCNAFASSYDNSPTYPNTDSARKIASCWCRYAVAMPSQCRGNAVAMPWIGASLFLPPTPPQSPPGGPKSLPYAHICMKSSPYAAFSHPNSRK